MCKQANEVAQYIVSQIQMGRFKKIGVWFSELSSNLLWQTVTAIPLKARVSLGSLLFYSLYDYCGLSSNHDQSTCYQLYSQLYMWGGLKPNVTCPLHNQENAQEMVHDQTPLDMAIIAAEYPKYPLMECESAEYRKNAYAARIDCHVRDYRSRYFERYAKTPESIRIASQKMVDTANEVLVIVKTCQDCCGVMSKSNEVNSRSAESIRLIYNARVIEVDTASQ